MLTVADAMDEIFKRILDKLPVSDFWIALGFLAAGYVCWWWIGTTTTGKKKMLRRQLGSGLLIAALAGAVILVNHSFFLREQGFSKNLTGVLVTRIVGDDPLNSLQGALVEKLNAELQKKRRGSRLKCMRAARSSMRTTVSRHRTNAPGLSGSGSMQ